MSSIAGRCVLPVGALLNLNNRQERVLRVGVGRGWRGGGAKGVRTHFERQTDANRDIAGKESLLQEVTCKEGYPALPTLGLGLSQRRKDENNEPSYKLFGSHPHEGRIEY